jgi:hypothetical protein
MYNLIADIYYSILVFRNLIFSKFAKDIDHKKIPIIINNRNRVTFLKMLIDSLKKKGYKNIYILDNASTYQPLLDFYKIVDCEVIMLGKNLGYDALDQIPLYNKLKKNYFVYTDSDVVPIEECPDDFLKFFLEILRKYPKIQKVGFSLKIDNLPDTFKDKQKVINWESQFFKEKIENGLFLASIDTTFALHRPYATLSTKGRFKMIRTAYPYTASHMPWYNNSNELTEEEQYYVDHVEIGTHWSKGVSVKNLSFFKRLKKKI